MGTSNATFIDGFKSDLLQKGVDRVRVTGVASNFTVLSGEKKINVRQEGVYWFVTPLCPTTTSRGKILTSSIMHDAQGQLRWVTARTSAGEFSLLRGSYLYKVVAFLLGIKLSDIIG